MKVQGEKAECQFCTNSALCEKIQVAQIFAFRKEFVYLKK